MKDIELIGISVIGVLVVTAAVTGATANENKMMNRGFGSHVVVVAKAVGDKWRYNTCHEEYEWMYEEQCAEECKWRWNESYPPAWQKRQLDECFQSLRRIGQEASYEWRARSEDADDLELFQ